MRLTQGSTKTSSISQSPLAASERHDASAPTTCRGEGRAARRRRRSAPSSRSPDGDRSLPLSTPVRFPVRPRKRICTRSAPSPAEPRANNRKYGSSRLIGTGGLVALAPGGRSSALRPGPFTNQGSLSATTEAPPERRPAGRAALEAVVRQRAVRTRRRRTARTGATRAAARERRSERPDTSPAFAAGTTVKTHGGRKGDREMTSCHRTHPRSTPQNQLGLSLFVTGGATITLARESVPSNEGLSRGRVKPASGGADHLRVSGASPAASADAAERRRDRSSSGGPARLGSSARRDWTGAARRRVFVATAAAMLPSPATSAAVGSERSSSRSSAYAVAVAGAVRVRRRLRAPDRGRVRRDVVPRAAARLLPLAVCAALVLASMPELVRRRMPVDRLALSVVSSWHAVGPALVLSVAGARTRRPWREVPIYAAALAAQFAFDFAARSSSSGRCCGVSPLGQLKAMAPAFAGRRDARAARTARRVPGVSPSVGAAAPPAGAPALLDLRARAAEPDRPRARALRRVPRHRDAARRRDRGGRRVHGQPQPRRRRPRACGR